MKSVLLIAIFAFASLLLLSSCAESSSAPTVTGINRLATQAVVQTQFAANATLSAQQTQAVFDAGQATVLAEQLRATQMAVVVNATMTAAADQATSTAAAAGTQQALAVTGTTQAIVAQANTLYYQQQQQQIDIRRRQMFNSILGMVVFIIILGVLALSFWWIWLYLRQVATRREVRELGDGSRYALPDRYSRRRVTAGTPGLVPAPVVDSQFYQPVQPPYYEPPVQPVQSGGLAGVRRVSPPEDLPVTADWRVVAEGWQGGDLPLGLGPDGLISVDPRNDPHLLITGTPGSGKANLAVRPAIAEALAQGWQAVIFDRTGNDFQVFQQHPNAAVVLLSEEGPGEVITYLRRLYAEVQRRQAVLDTAGVGRWTDLAESLPEMMVTFNNFSYEAAGTMSFPDHNELWEFARKTAAEGGDVGVHLVLVMEDPSFTDIDLRIRRYMAPVAFRADSALISRVVLNMDGAENLYPRQFIAILDGQLEFGYAFAPDSDDLKSFLARHPQAQLPRPEWLGEERQSNR